jgi:hypothetical protein
MTVLIILIFSFTFGNDTNSVAADKKPRYVVKISSVEDIGATIYWGLGYKVIEWDYMAYNFFDYIH